MAGQLKLSDGSDAPWAYAWGLATRKRFDAWFDAFKALGGSVDLIQSDFEMYHELTYRTFLRAPAWVRGERFGLRCALAGAALAVERQRGELQREF